jgi:hypothetical protein
MEYRSFNSFNIYNNLLVSRDNKLLFITMYGDIIFYDVLLNKICTIINPFTHLFDATNTNSNTYSDFIIKNGMTKGIINKKYIVIFNNNNLYVAKLPDLSVKQELFNINLEWTISNNPYKNANCNYNCIGSYDENFYVLLEQILYYYIPDNDKWYIIHPEIENTISKKEIYNYNNKHKNIIYKNIKNNFNCVIKLNDNRNCLENSVENNELSFIYKFINNNEDNIIGDIFTISTPNNLIVSIEDSKIKTISLEEYILDAKENKWIEREILNSLGNNIMDNLEFIVSCTIFKNYLIIASYKNLYYCPIGIWKWNKINIINAPEPYKSKYLFSIEDKDKDNIIDSGLANIWSNLQYYDSADTNVEEYIIAITIDGRIYKISEVCNNIVAVEKCTGSVRNFNIKELHYLLNNTIFMNKYKITFDNFEEEYKILCEKYKSISNTIETTNSGTSGSLNSVTTDITKHIDDECDVNTTISK